MQLSLRLIMPLLILPGTSAWAVPLLTGSATELGAYDLTAAVQLKDDGKGPDLAIGDRIFTATVTIAAGGTIFYKVVPDTPHPINSCVTL